MDLVKLVAINELRLCMRLLKKLLTLSSRYITENERKLLIEEDGYGILEGT